MAHLFRLKLQALYCPRLLSSPALASKLLNPPDPRHIPRRSYGESALLEDSTQNASDMNGGSMAAIQGEDLAKQGDGIEEKNGASFGSKLSSLDMDELRISIGKSRPKSNTTHDDKGKGVHPQVDRLFTKESNKPIKDEKWQQVVSTVRTMAIKVKSKAFTGGDKLGLPKTTQQSDDFSDLDLPQAHGESGISRGPNREKLGLPKTTEQSDDFSDLDLPQARGESGISRGPNRDSLAMTLFGKNSKQKNNQSQSSNPQKSKHTLPVSFSFLESVDANNSTNQTATTPAGNETDRFSGVKLQDARSHDRNQPRGKDTMPSLADNKLLKGKDSASPRASPNNNLWNQPRSKDAMQGSFDSKLSKGTDDTSSSAEMRGRIPSNTREAIPQPSNNNLSHTGYMVCVQNLPASSNPAMIKAWMAMHGEVLGFFKKTVRSDYLNVYIQFKTVEGMEGALAARKLQIGGKAFLIVRTDTIFTTVVRLTKVSAETSESQLLSICGRYGNVDNIRRRTVGVFDVFYQVKELPNMTNILGSLNQVMQHRSTWFALPAPILHPSVQKDALKSTEGQAWHEIQSYQAMNRIESALDNVSILFEDLKELTVLSKEYSKG